RSSRQGIGFAQQHRFRPAHDELGDARAARHRKRLPSVVNEQNPDFAAIIGVDGSRRVEHGDALFQRQPRARPDLALEARRQFDRESGRDQRPLARRQDARGVVRHGGDEVQARGVFGLAARRRQTLGMRQPPEFDSDHFELSNLSPITPIKPTATMSLVICGQEITLSRVTIWTWLSAAPNSSPPAPTALATIKSQFLRSSFSRAYCKTCSVSAANPTTKRGREFLALAIVARISGFSTSVSVGGPFAVFLSFWPCACSARQSATAAAAMNTSAGSAASTAASISPA